MRVEPSARNVISQFPVQCSIEGGVDSPLVEMVTDVFEVYVCLACLRPHRSDSWPQIMRGHIGELVIAMHLRNSEFYARRARPILGLNLHVSLLRRGN